MPDTTIKKVEADFSPKGEMGQRYLVAGKRVSMCLWIDEPGGKLKAPTAREYETVGYVLSGSAKLDLEGQTLNLKRGDSWLVPAGAMHQYTIIEPFTAVEDCATGRGPRSGHTRLSRGMVPMPKSSIKEKAPAVHRRAF
jgi:quercetin dioxygenase-like cupin family protein